MLEYGLKVVLMLVVLLFAVLGSFGIRGPSYSIFLASTAGRVAYFGDIIICAKIIQTIQYVIIYYATYNM